MGLLLPDAPGMRHGPRVSTTMADASREAAKPSAWSERMVQTHGAGETSCSSQLLTSSSIIR